jgi:hypothetical protein
MGVAYTPQHYCFFSAGDDAQMRTGSAQPIPFSTFEGAEARYVLPAVAQPQLELVTDTVGGAVLLAA